MRFDFIAASFAYSALLGVTNAASKNFDVIPGKPGYPSPSKWQQFNQSIGGNLHETVPWAAVCYPNSGHYDKTKCDDVNSGYMVGRDREVPYGATEQIQYEACGNASCQLFAQAPQLSLTALGKCELGSLSAYYVDAHTPELVSAAIKFAKENNIRVSIKNTGHDYLGRSVAPNTLAIWVRNMQNMRYFDTWSPTNCSGQYDGIGEMEAGVNARQVYTFFGVKGRDIPGGNAESVGLAGGYGQTGGHGVFAPARGLMVDNAVEFEVVTADGQIRTINECNDPDLFWAMRGGGGGNYAVLTKYRFKTFPGQPVSMHVFRANLSVAEETLSNDRILRSLFSAHIKNQVNWSNHNVSGRHYYASDFVEFYTILSYPDDGSLLKEVTKDFVDEISQIPGLHATENKYYHYDNYLDYNAPAQKVAARVTPNGNAAAVSSRLTPRWLFAPENQTKLTDAMIKGMKNNVQINQLLSGITGIELLMTTPANFPDSEGKTSANPSWRTALWHPIFIGGWSAGTPTSQQQQIIKQVHDSANPLRELTPGGGAYTNEDSVILDDWKQTWWGPNYDRLLSIKNKYDPEHFFDCYKCVGWRGVDDFAYSCYGDDPTGATIKPPSS